MENFKQILPIIQIIVSVILVVVILMQSRGSGLGGVFGGSGNVFRTKRGIEKSLHTITIIFSVIFLATAIAGVIL